ncbi:MAG: DUF881 domain-containing protein [Actinobacteria bacterium]|nr:DUF881 domain-containing protein [Actinomycetota bacterium]MCG2798450.1 DUF881 domain-containing protein [Cellulomonas sp.]
MTPRHGGEPAREPDASMNLLSDVFRRPLEPGYHEAARRRAAHPEERTSRTHQVSVLLITVLLGLSVTAATIALRQPSSAAVQARALLERQIDDQTARADGAQETITTTSTELTALQEEVLAGEDPLLLARLQQDAGRSGVVAVRGPGLRVELADAPAADGEDEPDLDHRVQDVDLQVVVNGLWAAGAEAIAINGTRLTSTTAIRSAGSAVLVDLVALSSPYQVDAIGDSATLQTELALGSAGQHLATLRDSYDIDVSVTARNLLELPGTGQVNLRFASTPQPATSASAGAGVAGSVLPQEGSSP